MGHVTPYVALPWGRIKTIYTGLFIHQTIWSEHLWCRSRIIPFFPAGSVGRVGTWEEDAWSRKSTICLVLPAWDPIIKHEILLHVFFPPATWYKTASNVPRIAPDRTVLGSVGWTPRRFCRCVAGPGAGGWICRDMPSWMAQRPGETGELESGSLWIDMECTNGWKLKFIKKKTCNWRFETEYWPRQASNHVCISVLTHSLSLSLSLSLLFFSSLDIYLQIQNWKHLNVYVMEVRMSREWSTWWDSMAVVSVDTMLYVLTDNFWCSHILLLAISHQNVRSFDLQLISTFCGPVSSLKWALTRTCCCYLVGWGEHTPETCFSPWLLRVLCEYVFYSCLGFCI